MDDEIPTHGENISIFDHGIHFISLMGWDDSIGRWIYKDSLRGFGQIKYNSSMFLAVDRYAIVPQNAGIAYIFENTIDYHVNYQTDLNGLTGFDSNYTFYSNEFTSKYDELIGAVGTYFNESGIDYSFDVYVNDELVHSQSGVSEFAGFRTIVLNNYIPIKPGDKFNVVFKNNALPYQAYSRQHYVSEMSFVSSDGDAFSDITLQNKTVCLKVYTIEGDMVDTKLIAPDRIAYVSSFVDGYVYSAILRDANGTALAGKEVVFTFDGKNYTATTDSNGWANVTLKANAEGYYDVTVSFKGDKGYDSVTRVNSIALVKEHTKFIAPDRVVYVNEFVSGYNYSAILKTNDCKALANKRVAIVFDGKQITRVTDSKGWVFFKLITNKVGTYKITLKFEGDNCYRPVTEYRTISLVKEAADLVIANKNFKVNDKKSVAVNLNSKSGNAIGNVKVTLNVDGKTYASTTNINGVALFQININKKGIFPVIADFAENMLFRQAVGRTTLIVS